LLIATALLPTDAWSQHPEFPSFYQGLPFERAVSLGKVPGVTRVVIRGHNPDVDIAEDIWFHGGDLSYLSSAEQMNVVSTSTSDNNTVGPGAFQVLLVGLDSNFDEVSEVIDMDATSNVLSDNSYIRVNSMTALGAGSSGTNVGDITATAATAGTVQAHMEAGTGLSKKSHYTVPDGHTLCVTQVELNVTKAGGATPRVDFSIEARVGGSGNSWLEFFARDLDVDVANLEVVRLPTMGCNPTSRSDLRARATTTQVNTDVRLRMYGLLFDNSIWGL
jgi:hypothetical protein